ncbi:hypothetical protein WA158_002672 [Blastocystis sp. Blastoise]
MNSNEYDDESCEAIEEDFLDPETEKRAIEVLKTHTKQLSPIWSQRFDKDAGKYWNLFYKSNGDRFYKDRHYLDTVFPEFKICNDHPEMSYSLLEVGCGVGNAFFPLSETFPNLYIYAVDFSQNAINLIQNNPKYDPDRMTVWAGDVTKQDILTHLPQDGVHFVLILFALSANSPNRFVDFLTNATKELKQGGYVFFRDYARYDMAELRFNPERKIDDNFYARQDGTRTYYFEIQELTNLFKGIGLMPIDVKYIRRTIINRKTEQEMNRIWIQGRFQKI